MTFYTVAEVWAVISQVINDAGLSGLLTPFIKGTPTAQWTSDPVVIGGVEVGRKNIRVTVNWGFYTVGEFLSGVAAFLNTNPPGIGGLLTPIPKGGSMDIQVTQLPGVRVSGDSGDGTAIAVAVKGDAALPVAASISVSALPAVSASVTSLPAVSVGLTAMPVINAAVTSIPPVSVGVTALPPVQATVGGTATPIKIDLGSLGFQPGIKMTFHLFGLSFLPLLSIRIRGNASFGS